VSAAAPLAGLLVVDCSRVLAGPYVTMLLGDLGARVIKVEHPDGDSTRQWGPPFVGPEDARESTYFLSVNRNKESVVLDFRLAQDRETLSALLSRADVLVENFRPGVMDRLGFGAAALEALNPRLVHLSVTGFGPDGPEAGRAGYDHILQGEGGLMSVTGPDPQHPTRIGVPVVDVLAGAFGAVGVLAALQERERTGRGRQVHTSLLAAAIGSHVYQGTRWLVAGEVPGPIGNHHPQIAPYGTFRCGDQLLLLGVGTEAQWLRLAEILGLDAAEPRFRRNRDRVRHRAALVELIETRLASRPLAAWLAELEAAGIPAGEVRRMDQVYASPQVAAQGLVMEVDHPSLGRIRLPGSPLRFSGGAEAAPVPSRPPPGLGEHTETVRRWLAGDGTSPAHD